MGAGQKIRALAEAFDPRALLRTRQRLDDVRDASRELRQALNLLEIRTDQLMALERANWQQREQLERLPKVLTPARIESHVRSALERAVIHDDPLPYCVVEDWLPDDIYDLVLDAIPPLVFFADRPAHKQQLTVPPPVAPEYSRQIWDYMARGIVNRVVGPTLRTVFDAPLDRLISGICPGGAGWRDAVEMNSSDGRLMLRRPGYVIEPHRDPGWGFITCLAYLARPGDNEAYGTQLYRVREDEAAPDESAFYVRPAHCELARSVPFKRNTMLVFLNGSGAHGASIPPDAQPADLERYLYQFRLGPTAHGIRWLLARMPEEERRRWSGLKTEKAGGY